MEVTTRQMNNKRNKKKLEDILWQDFIESVAELSQACVYSVSQFPLLIDVCIVSIAVLLSTLLQQARLFSDPCKKETLTPSGEEREWEY